MLNSVPEGYAYAAQYDFNGKTCNITLTSSVIPAEDGEYFIPPLKQNDPYYTLGSVMHDFKFTDTDGNDYSMIKDWNEVELSLQPTGNDYGLITDLDEELIDEIDILRDYSTITFNGNIVMGCENVSGNMIDQDSHIDIIADFALPLKFNIENLLYTYTMPFNLSLGMDTVGEDESSFNVENVFDELEFKFVFENALPVQIEPQLYMLQNGTVIDSLFSNEACIHGYFGGELVQDIITVSVVEEKLDNVQLADQLMMKINFSSLGNTVTINTNDYFNLRLGLKTKTSEINMEDFNF
jgi:hypothetical protein